MDRKLKSFIDNSIIREYAFKGRNGYSLDISDVDAHDQENFYDLLFSRDEVLRSMILDRMQTLINERIDLVEHEDAYTQGLKPIHDSQTGEVTYVPEHYRLLEV